MTTTKTMRARSYVLVAAGLLLAGCRPKVTPWTDHPRVAPGVRMQDVSFFSQALKRQMPYRVFLPAEVAAGKRLPVVYLLHGGNGGFKDWSNDSEVSQYAGIAKTGGLILVMPEGAFSYYQNAVLKPEDRFDEYLTKDLIADVEGRFPVAQERERRALIGISMGGFAAIKIALTKPQLFVFAGAFSPSIEVLHRKFSPKRIGEWWRIRSIFGPMGSDARRSMDPFALVQSAQPPDTPYIYLSAGEHEPLLEPNRRFTARLKERHFAYEFHTKPGGHDWAEWDAQIPGCFESLMHQLHAGH